MTNDGFHDGNPIDEVLSEERQLMKWVGIFQVGLSWVRIFRREKFSRRKFDGWEFFGRDFPRTSLDIKPHRIRDYDDKLDHGTIIRTGTTC